MLLVFAKPLKLQELTRYRAVCPKGQRVCMRLPLPLHLALALFMTFCSTPQSVAFPLHRNEVEITDGKGSEIHPLLQSEV